MNDGFVYEIQEEMLGKPTLKVDESNNNSNVSKFSDIISEYTGIDRNKLIFFIEQFGVDTIISNPSIVGVTKDQEQRLLELKVLLA